MKIIDENPISEGVNTPPKQTPPPLPTPPAPPKSYATAGRIYLGCILALVGLLWLGNNYNIITGLAADIIFSVWMLLIAVGGYLLTLRKTTAGLIVMLIGMVMLLTDTLDCYISFHRIILPVIMVIIGVSIIFARKRK